MSGADHIANLRIIADAWPEGSPQRKALIAAIADMERLDKVERMKIFVRWEGDCERAWVGSSLDPSGFENRRKDLRTSIDLIDGVPE